MSVLSTEGLISPPKLVISKNTIQRICIKYSAQLDLLVICFIYRNDSICSAWAMSTERPVVAIIVKANQTMISPACCCPASEDATLGLASHMSPFPDISLTQQLLCITE